MWCLRFSVFAKASRAVLESLASSYRWISDEVLRAARTRILHKYIYFLTGRKVYGSKSLHRRLFHILDVSMNVSININRVVLSVLHSIVMIEIKIIIISRLSVLGPLKTKTFNPPSFHVSC